MSDVKAGAGGSCRSLRDQSMVDAGLQDLVWDGSLNLKAESVELQFLGVSRYQPLIDDIYRGLGIPASLLKAEDSR